MPGGTLVGRESETTAIDALLASGGALTLVGARGLGRSALVTYAVEAARGRTVLRADGVIGEELIPFGLLQRLLTPVKGTLPALPVRSRAALARALSGHPGADPTLVALAVLGLLTRAARHAPLLCCVDDLHLADPQSRAAVAFCARRVPIALLVTTTDQELHGVPASQLAALPRAAARTMVRDLLGDDPAVPGIVATGQGNPQALVALATGEDPPGYAEWADHCGPALLIAACDEHLTPTDLLRTGVDLARLAPAERAGVVKVGPDLVRLAHPAARTAIYHRYPANERRDAHLLLARTLDPTTQRLRILLHRAAADPSPDVAEALAQATGPSRTVPHHVLASEALARSAELTADPGRAAARLREAAGHAWLAGHPHRSRVLLERCSVFAATPTCDGATHLLAGELELRWGSPTRAVDLLLAAADRLTDPLAGARALVRACEAICFSGDRARFAEVAARVSTVHRPGATVETVMLLDYVEAYLALFGGALRRALGGFRRVAERGAKLADPDALIWASAASLLVADDAAGRRLALRAVAMARRSGNLAALPHALEMRAYAEYWLGRYADAEATSREGARCAEATGQDNGAGHHRGMLAVLAAVRGGALPATDLCGDRPAAFRHWAQAVVDLREGRPEEARQRLDAIADPLTGHGHVFVQTMASPYLVEAAASAASPSTTAGPDPGPPSDATGPDTRASAALAVLQHWADTTGDPIRTALSSRCHALLAPRGSAEAEEHFAEALRWHALASSPFERARTDLLYARDLRRRRRPSRARDHLLTALSAFQQVGAPAWEAQAEAELMATGHQPGVLTAQQSRIAGLAAEGATNREIAAKLFLSTRTVDHHMRNIFVRLGVHNRTELSHALIGLDRSRLVPGPP